MKKKIKLKEKKSRNREDGFELLCDIAEFIIEIIIEIISTCAVEIAAKKR